ncbi:MAG: TetR/AcrR family transcriptional regulator [Deltaproteobacteria bacterium]|nr:TetR/AcrR family transcriptional regulator [Deltaproteobacteria bacterium]
MENKSNSRGSEAAKGSARARGRSKAASKRKAAHRLADARTRMYHELIFESAEGVFGRKGYEGATMQDIADEAGVSLKTVYATYESKQDLYDQIMRERAGGLVALLGSAVETAEDPLEQISRIVEAYVAFVFENEDWLRIHLRARVAWAFRPSDAGIAVSWAAARDIYSGVLSRGMQSGLFYPGDPEETAVLVQSVMQVQMARAVELGRDDPGEVAEAMMVHIRRLLCPR